MAETTPKTPAPKKAAAKPVKAAAADAKAKKAAPKKAADPSPVKKTPAPRQSAEKKTVVVMTVSNEQRYLMIAEAAYFRAESRDFKSDPVRDWIEAERDIAILLGED